VAVNSTWRFGGYGRADRSRKAWCARIRAALDDIQGITHFRRLRWSRFELESEPNGGWLFTEFENQLRFGALNSIKAPGRGLASRSESSKHRAFRWGRYDCGRSELCCFAVFAAHYISIRKSDLTMSNQ